MTTTIPQWLSYLIDNLTPQQYAFVMSDDKVASYVNERVSGKTHAGIIRCLRLAYEHPGIIILFCDATTSDAARYTYEGTARLIPDGAIKTEVPTRREITLTNGSRLVFQYLQYGARLREALRGVICDAVHLDNNEYLSYRDFITLFVSTRRKVTGAQELQSPLSYAGEVEWRSWRELGPKEAIRAPMLEAGQYVDGDSVVVDAEDV